MANLAVQSGMPSDQFRIVVRRVGRRSPTRGAMALIALQRRRQMPGRLPRRGLPVMARVAPAGSRRIVAERRPRETRGVVALIALRGRDNVIGRFTRGGSPVVAGVAPTRCRGIVLIARP